ncbi:MAG: MltA domain-containing protein, partial [Cyanobacteria bacterium P01_C01_bin.121]
MRTSLKAPVKVFSQAFTLAIALSLTSAFSYAEEVLAPLTQLHCRDRRQATELISQDTRLFDSELTAGDRQALLTAIDHSLDYISTPGSIEAYSEYPVEGVTHDRVRRSLQRFRTLVLDANSAEALQQAVAAEFDFYQAIGQDDEGTVAFTGYFEPTYKASLTPSEQYRYPIYRAPAGLDQWAEPHPTRADLEGTDGLQADQGPLKGLEIAWLPTRLEAFLIQVQGSARLELENGTTLSVGYDGRTNYPYVSMGRELINDGIIPEDELTLPVLLEYFEQNPEALDSYLPRNNRFVFFRET